MGFRGRPHIARWRPAVTPKRIRARYVIIAGTAVATLGAFAIVSTTGNAGPAKRTGPALAVTASTAGRAAGTASAAGPAGGAARTAGAARATATAGNAAWTARADGTAGVRLTTHAGPVLNGPFVALGDSYAAAPLVPASPTGFPAGCLRSTHNYSADVAASLLAVTYIDAACSGAKTTGMTQSQSTSGGVNPPQFTALAANDSLVTVTIGGNDVGFASILTECISVSATSPFGNPCQRHYTSGGTDQLAAAVAAAGPKVAAVLRGIRAHAPLAKILLVGYPDILPATGTGCWPLVPLAHGDVPYLRATEISLNQVLAQAAASNGATYVDTYTPTIGHDVCESPGTKWVEGLVPTSPAYPFHPNQHGEQAMASAVLAALGA